MIKNYVLSSNRHLVETDAVGNFTYILQPTRAEIGAIAEHFDFPFDYLGGILDDYENARFETDAHDNNLILLQYPAQTAHDEIGTFPYSLIWTKTESVILALNHEMINAPIFERNYDIKRYDHQLVFEIMQKMTQAFNEYLYDFRKRRRALEAKIKNSTKNDQIVDLIQIQASLIYFEDALDNNIQVLRKFIDYLRHQGEDGFAERIYDIFIEMDQAYTETQIQLKLLVNLRDLFSNIVSNNLNIVMKIMTSATFVLGIPAAIFGFYGINVPIPGQHHTFMMWLIIGVTLIICGWAVWLLRKKDMI